MYLLQILSRDFQLMNLSIRFTHDGIYVGYRYYDSFNVPTAYEFGYGLSYTTFEYSDLKLSSTNFSSKMKVTVTVKNTGKVAGKEIVQLYLCSSDYKD